MPPKSHRARYIAAALVIFAGLSGAVLYINFRAARLAAGALASVLGRPVSVAAVGFGPAAGLSLHGVEVENTPGYPSPYLLRIDALNVRPAYKEIFKGRLVLDSITVASPSLNLDRTSRGVWNFQALMDHLKKRKPRRYTIGILRIKDARAAFAPGNLEILVPRAEVSGLSTLKQGAVLKASLDGTVSGVRPSYYKGKSDLTARTDLHFSYIPDKDELDIEKARLDLAGLVGVDLSGRVAGLKKSASADLTARVSPVDLSRAAPYLPGGLRLSGTLRPDVVKIKGAMKPFDAQVEGGAELSSLALSYKGVSAAGINGKVKFIASMGGINLSGAGEAAGNPYDFKAGAEFSGGQGLKNPYMSGSLNVVRPAPLNSLLERFKSPVSMAGGTAGLYVSLKGESVGAVGGTARVKLNGLGLDKAGRPLIRGLSGEFRPLFNGKAATLPPAYVNFGGSFKLNISGSVAMREKGWQAKAALDMPETGLGLIQEGVLEALPPWLKWADVSGKAALKAGLSLSSDGKGRLTGELRLRDARIGIPDKVISAGPADGAVPLEFAFGGGGAKPGVRPFRDEAFEKESYAGLLKKYSAGPGRAGLVIKKVSYGLVELDDIKLDFKPGGGYYGVDWFGLSVFGGRAYGYGLADFTGREAGYSLSLIVSDFSLMRLCDSVPAIKGYISGSVDGLARVLVSGRGLDGVAGAAMFWAKDAPGEKMNISKEFLKRLMGKTLKGYMLIGDRRFDTGELDVIFSGGDVVFDNLLISHTDFLGRQDLTVRVAPVSNKISIGHLLDVVREVKERAGSAQ